MFSLDSSSAPLIDNVFTPHRLFNFSEHRFRVAALIHQQLHLLRGRIYPALDRVHQPLAQLLRHGSQQGSGGILHGLQCVPGRFQACPRIAQRLTDAFVRRIKQLSSLEVDCLKFHYLDVNGAPALYFEFVERVPRAGDPKS